MENKTEMKELNLNEMSNAAGGINPRMTKEIKKKGLKALRDLAADIYKKWFAPEKTLD